jgi:23S rRNA (adenine2030-N6)-methyltransferase
MLSYRHAFHAGNAADVLKHTLLVFCLDYLCTKEKPLLYLDTHAGAGLYSLTDGYADQNREWENGFGKIARLCAGNMPEPVLRYAACAEGASYHGSPALAQKCLRPHDRLVCYEQHPADFQLLAALFANDPRAEARRADGFSGLRALLPPPSRRACVLIDPSYELKDDYEKTRTALAGALARFPTATYLVWYPLLRRDDSGQMLRDDLMALSAGKRCFLELCTAERDAPTRTRGGGLYGSGLVAYNPPFTLQAVFSETLPFLAQTMNETEGAPATWRLEWYC